MQTNASPGAYIIDFNILPATGSQTTSILSQLPALTDFAEVLIDGLTQTGLLLEQHLHLH